MTDVDICNLALLDLGQPAISAIGESSKAGRAFAVAYEPTLQELLRDHPWNFARKRETLAADPIAPAFDWDNRFKLPTKCVRVLEVNDALTKYKIEGRYLLVNDDAPDVIYIERVDESEFDPLFASAFAAVLAARLCIHITDNATAQQGLLAVARDKLDAAKATNAQEVPPDDPPLSTWEQARACD